MQTQFNSRFKFLYIRSESKLLGVVATYLGTKTAKFGWSLCNEKDQFDKGVAKLIATSMARMTSVPKNLKELPGLNNSLMNKALWTIAHSKGDEFPQNLRKFAREELSQRQQKILNSESVSNG